MALSPFEITWAFDSNVYACPGAFAMETVTRFLLAAERTSLWGFDVAHANLGTGHTMAPHCFDMIWRWTPRTSNVFRDWLMLMMRKGLSADDQGPLGLAEARQVAATRGEGLRVGQVPTEFATSFYSARPPQFYPRATRWLRGPAYIVHGSPIVSSRTRGASGQELCKAFNVQRGTRRQLLKRRRAQQPLALYNESACRDELSLPSCPFVYGERPEGMQYGLLPATVPTLEQVGELRFR